MSGYNSATQLRRLFRIVNGGTPPADQFDTEGYQILIVAEKFQTGFDQPLLHTMYVDKILTGLAAVQTLSRLNRIHPLKSDTFILDFRNDAEEIRKAFEPYYGRTVAPPTDPNLLFDTRRRLDDFDVLRPEEVEAAVALFLTITDPRQHGQVYALLDPAVDRFKALEEESRLGFKDALDKFVRTYSFLSQVVSFGDSKLERDYLYCRALAACVRDAATVERLDLGAQVELTHLRSEIAFEGSLTLASDTGEVKSIFGPRVRSPAGPASSHYDVAFPPDIHLLCRDARRMDEATALLSTLAATPADAPTACAGWTAHELVAHLAAGAAEMADLTEATVAGRAERATRAFGEREAPYVALDDDELRDRMVTEALRLHVAVQALEAAGAGTAVAFSGRRLSAADLSMHGRSEAALHRWDLAGDDGTSRELLAQPELTAHAVTVLNSMLDSSSEAVARRAAAAGIEAGARIAFGSPGQPDVVLVVNGDGARLELDDPSPTPAANADPATRLLALWGRRSSVGTIGWNSDDVVCTQLAGFLWT